MRLPEGIVVDAEKTFGELKFAAMRRENFVQDADGKSTGELKGRTYDLRCKAQGMTIQVTLPAEVEEKKFEYGARVELVEPYIDTIATATYGGRANAGWYIKAKDIVEASGTGAGQTGTAGQAGKAGQTNTAKPQAEQAAKKS